MPAVLPGTFWMVLQDTSQAGPAPPAALWQWGCRRSRCRAGASPGSLTEPRRPARTRSSGANTPLTAAPSLLRPQAPLLVSRGFFFFFSSQLMTLVLIREKMGRSLLCLKEGLASITGMTAISRTPRRYLDSAEPKTQMAQQHVRWTLNGFFLRNVFKNSRPDGRANRRPNGRRSATPASLTRVRASRRRAGRGAARALNTSLPPRARRQRGHVTHSPVRARDGGRRVTGSRAPPTPSGLSPRPAPPPLRLLRARHAASPQGRSVPRRGRRRRHGRWVWSGWAGAGSGAAGAPLCSCEERGRGGGGGSGGGAFPQPWKSGGRGEKAVTGGPAARAGGLGGRPAREPWPRRRRRGVGGWPKVSRGSPDINIGGRALLGWRDGASLPS